MKASWITIVAMAFAVGWMAVVGVAAINNWPRIPLDVPRSDPAVRAAHNRAVTIHVLSNGLAASVPLIFIGIGLLLRSRRRD